MRNFAYIIFNNANISPVHPFGESKGRAPKPATFSTLPDVSAKERSAKTKDYISHTAPNLTRKFKLRSLDGRIKVTIYIKNTLKCIFLAIAPDALPRWESFYRNSGLFKFQNAFLRFSGPRVSPASESGGQRTKLAGECL